MNSDYTQFNDYYKNQNNYIPTRYYCEAFASAEIAYFDISQTADGFFVKVDASQISSNNNITKNNSTTFDFEADKILTNIKSLNVFVWNPNLSQYETSLAALNGPIRLGLGSNNVYNKIYIGKPNFTLQTFFGGVNILAKQAKLQAKAATPPAVIPNASSSEYTIPIARVYVTY
jgi:hypothetical protein